MALSLKEVIGKLNNDEALALAVNIIHEVWCDEPDKANAVVIKMTPARHWDRIPDVWEEMK